MVAVTLADLEGQGLRVRTDGTRLLVGPRERVTAEVIELIQANREWLLSLALGRAIVRARPDDWVDPEPDICVNCGAPAVGYTRMSEKACAAHLGEGARW